MRHSIIFILFLLYAACKQKETLPLGPIKIGGDSASLGNNIYKTDCDSVYGNKGYVLTQEYFANGIPRASDYNTIFRLSMEGRGDNRILFEDTIFSSNGDIEFRDFNGDKVRDILVQNISDVRSNWTFNLYLIDTTKNTLTKVRGFDEIKNPRYIPAIDLVDNNVNSEINWTTFYKIKGDTVKDFGITVYQENNETYDKEYERAIQKILRMEKAR